MRKVIFITAIVLLVAAVGGYWYFKTRKLEDFAPLIKERLKEVIAKASDSLYVLEYDKLDLDLDKSTISLINARLRPDSDRYNILVQRETAPDDVMEVSVKAIVINDITPAEILNDRVVDLKVLYIQKPEVTVIHRPQEYNRRPKEKLTYNNLHDNIKSDIKRISIGEFWLREVNFTYNNVPRKNKIKFDDVDFKFSELLVDSTTHLDSTRFLYARNLSIKVPEHTILTGDSLYRLRMHNLEIDTKEGSMEMDSVSIRSRVSETEFDKIVGVQKDRFNARVQKIRLGKIKWYDLLQQKDVGADTLIIRNGTLDIYNNRQQPPKKGNKLGTYPNQQLAKLDFPFQIKYGRISNLDITYREKSVQTGRIGEIKFTNTNATIRNVVNEDWRIRKNPVCMVDATTSFMGSGKLHALFAFDMANARQGIFTVKGDLRDLHLPAVNPASVDLAKTGFEKGNVTVSSFVIKAQETYAVATVQASYKDLKIAMYKEDDGDMKKKGAMNLLANLIMKNDKEGKLATITLERDINRSMFNLLWKSIFAATKASLEIKK